MTVRRGEIWWADLDPTRGSEQAGRRPVLIFQSDAVNHFTTTVLAIPLTTNVRRAALPTCVLIGTDGGLPNDSVAICHQLRALDKRRLSKRIGAVGQETLDAVESSVLFTMGIVGE